MVDTELWEERKHSEDVLRVVNEQLHKVQNANPWAGTTDSRVANHMAEMYLNQEQKLKKAQKSPYFGRIDFDVDEKDEEDFEEDFGPRFYIGKTMVMDDHQKIEVVDWRAPIATLYYDADIGRVCYEAPYGVINGDLSLKRRYKFEEGKLLEFKDISFDTVDSLLLESLSDSSDNRLKSIVTTIQKEQNKIIRKELSKSIIVQGVAGSGKTTVALHRISYLLYTFSKYLAPENILILAPNKIFLNYISNTLPDIEVDNISQNTFDEFAKELLGIKYDIISQNETFSNSNINQNLLNARCSMLFEKIIRNYILILEKKILDSITSFIYNEIVLVEKSEISNIFNENRELLSITERLKRVQGYINRRIGIILDGNSKVKVPGNLRLDLRNNYTRLCNDYMKKLQVGNAISNYLNLFAEKSLFVDFSSEEYETMRKDVTSCLKEKMIRYEDLPGIILLHYYIDGIALNNNYKCIVIDEVQDMGLLHLYVLKKIFKNSFFSIFGDLTQGIYARGIDNWEEVNNAVFSNKAEIIPLVQSYRTTIEIMNEANLIAKQLQTEISIELANPVLRHGDNVRFHDEYDIKNLIDNIISLKQTGRKTIAIITKTTEEAKKIFDLLKVEVKDVNIISDDTKQFAQGIVVLPSYLSKGLEFDSVIVLNASLYKNSVLDGKLLYVSLTRAMHTLDVYNCKECSWLNRRIV